MKPYLLIVAVNIISQGFLFILTGTFWDDFIYLDYNIETLYHQFIATGTPERIFLIQSVWEIPHYGYRIITWICYCLTSVLYYLILRESSFFTRKDSLIITLVFISVPLNVCRLTLCTIVYAFSILLFASAFLMLISYLKYNRYIIFRWISLILFFCSFFMNSNLFFYIIPYLYIIYHSGGHRLNMVKCCFFKKMIKNLDYTMLPIVFFFMKEMLFPAYGNYREYNNFGIAELIKGGIYACGGVFSQILSIFKCYLAGDEVFTFTFLFILFGGVIKILSHGGLKDNKSVLISSFVLLIIASYPYLVVRQSFLLSVSGVNDRDAILLPIGFSLLIYSLAKILLNERFMSLCIVFIILGSVAQNVNYLKYQRIEYWQRSLAECMKNNREVQENNTFLFFYQPYFDTDYGIRFYSLNGISSFYAFGKQDKCWINGINELETLDKIEDYSKGYCMDDYNINDRCVDGVVIFKCDYSLLETIKIKYLEMNSQQKYMHEIKSHGNMIFLEANK